MNNVDIVYIPPKVPTHQAMKLALWYSVDMVIFLLLHELIYDLKEISISCRYSLNLVKPEVVYYKMLMQS